MEKHDMSIAPSESDAYSIRCLFIVSVRFKRPSIGFMFVITSWCSLVFLTRQSCQRVTLRCAHMLIIKVSSGFRVRGQSNAALEGSIPSLFAAHEGGAWAGTVQFTSQQPGAPSIHLPRHCLASKQTREEPKWSHEWSSPDG